MKKFFKNAWEDINSIFTILF
ncbi:hypothetical protein CCGE531_01660 [Rhizobium sp. CCGE531]|nr:hypothetical protein CCGE531_01660 [Rhizobium sp. CCGE531]AYG74392.1 hypothetical protein CCGE532_01650 [Rhizobium sp. CCGE532]